MTTGPRFPDWVSGACLLVRRADAEAVGLLDERYFMYTEDVDFCAAIRARGGRIRFTPARDSRPSARPLGGSAHATATDAAYRRSQLAFYEKHHPRWRRCCAGICVSWRPVPAVVANVRAQPAWSSLTTQVHPRDLRALSDWQTNAERCRVSI